MPPPRPPATRARILVSAVAGVALLVVLMSMVLKRPEGIDPRETLVLTGETMATTWQVKVLVPVVDTEQDLVTPLARAVQAELDAVDETLSHYREDSDIGRLNRWTEPGPMTVAPETVAILELARTVSEHSGGAFDVTVGPLVGLWGFHRKQALDAEPDPAELAALRQDVGYGLLELDPTGPSVTKRRPGVQVDLSAIAKGHGVDRVAEALDALGHGDYLVEVGGEVRTRGDNALGEPWRIGVERPLDDRREVQRAIAVRDAAMATSGDYRSFYELDGRRVSHTIDPRSGRPIEHALASATVLDETCAAADAWATALMVLGPEEGLATAEREGLAALLLVRLGDGSFEERGTTAFDDLMLTAERSAP